MSDNVNGREYSAALALIEISNNTTEREDNAAQTLIEMRNNVHSVRDAESRIYPRWSEGRRRTPSHLSEEGICRRIKNIGGDVHSIQILAREKRLSASDVSKNQNRLNIGQYQIIPEFLREEEKYNLIGHRDGNLPVILIEPCGQQSRITLKMWQIGGGGNLYYVLTTQWWESVVKKHKIEAGDTLRVLSFRDGDGKLGIALVKNPTGGN